MPDVPDGCIRFINYQGEIYEGQACNGHFNGWGRLVELNGKCSIGFWKDSLLQGNSRVYDEDGEIIEQGWFENGKCMGPFDKQSSEYPYWEEKHSVFGLECFIPEETADKQEI